jgi:PucR family transcriptional regulator, purine catabolism regulatory protein
MGEVANARAADGRDLTAGALDQRLTLLERRDEVQRELVNVLLAGGDLTEIAARIRDHFGACVLVCTSDGRELSMVGPAALVTAARASTLFHEGVRFRTEHFVPGLHQVPELPGSYAVVPVSGGRMDLGRLVLLHPHRTMDVEDLAVLERASDVVAICLTNRLAVTAVESKYRGDFLRDVLSGRAGDSDDVVRHARTLGWELERPQVVVVAALETESAPPMSRGYQGPLELERFAAAWSSVVGAHHPAAPVVGFAAEVVALLPVETPGTEREVVERTVRGVRGDGGGGRRTFAAGISRVVSTADDLAAAYEQARKAVAAGRRLHGPDAVAHFDDLGVFRLLSLIEDATEVDRFVAETLQDLAPGTASSPEAATLRETLQVLLDTNLNVAEAARTLHFHYNTLRYRIGKIERAVGPFTSDPALRLDLALALRIVTLRAL